MSRRLLLWTFGYYQILASRSSLMRDHSFALWCLHNLDTLDNCPASVLWPWCALLTKHPEHWTCSGCSSRWPPCPGPDTRRLSHDGLWRSLMTSSPDGNRWWSPMTSNPPQSTLTSRVKEQKLNLTWWREWWASLKSPSWSEIIHF